MLAMKVAKHQVRMESFVFEQKKNIFYSLASYIWKHKHIDSHTQIQIHKRKHNSIKLENNHTNTLHEQTHTHTYTNEKYLYLGKRKGIMYKNNDFFYLLSIIIIDVVAPIELKKKERNWEA